MSIDNAISMIGDNAVFLVFIHAAIHARSEISKIYRKINYDVKQKNWSYRRLYSFYLATALFSAFIVAGAPAIYYGCIAMGRIFDIDVGH